MEKQILHNRNKGTKGKHSNKYIFYNLRFGCSFAVANTIKSQLL